MYEFGKECECGLLNTKRNLRRAEFAAIPEIFANVTWEDFRTDVYSSGFTKSAAESALDNAKMWTENMPYNMSEGIGLYMYSRAKGSGKTMMACIIGNELMRQGYGVLFATTLDILDKIKETWNDGKEKESDVLKKLITAPVLILDDIGVEGTKDWIRERFYKIINDRYVNKKPIIYTSNVDAQYLKIDSRISNRIEEVSYMIEFPNESLRVGKGTALNMNYAQRAKEYRSKTA